MALIKCVECAKEISDKAASCPNCGAPVATKTDTTLEIGTPQSVSKAKVFQRRSRIILEMLWNVIEFIRDGIAKPIFILIAIIFIVVIAFFGIRTIASNGGINKAAEVILNSSPVTLIDGVENLQAHSWQALPITLPYSGMLTIEASVENGNNIKIEVINREDFQVFENKGSYGVYTNFSAPKTLSYKRSSRMAAGNYYLLLQDKTWGILSSKASDVRVLAVLTQ